MRARCSAAPFAFAAIRLAVGGIGDREQAKPINVVVGGSSLQAVKRGPPPPPPPAGQPIPVTGEEFNAASKAEARRPEQ